MVAALNVLPPLQALAVCSLGLAAGTLAAAFLAYEAVGFVRLAWRGR